MKEHTPLGPAAPLTGPEPATDAPLQNAAGSIAEAATGAAYGGALGAPGGPIALLAGALAGALAATRSTPDQAAVEDSEKE